MTYAPAPCRSRERGREGHPCTSYHRRRAGDPGCCAGRPASRAGDPGCCAGRPASRAGDPGCCAGRPASRAGDPGCCAGRPASRAGDPGCCAGRPASRAGDLGCCADDPVTRADGRSSHAGHRESIATPVQIRLFDNENRESETAAIIQRIADLKFNDPQASIAVLVASRSHAAPIMTGLEARKIDAVGVDLVPLRELSIVRDLVALIQATSHLGDRTAWLAVLRAPWCGLSLATLTVLSQRRDTLLVWESYERRATSRALLC